MSKVAIQPRVLKGFRDLLPQSSIPRGEMLGKIVRVFESFGFAPIDTPALEYAEILLGKGSDETDKQLYRFEDNGKRDVALRFDLTVPLARFVAMHINQLGTPFRRYHIAPVWRAEKPQRGRYREFMQCDFDIIGTRSAVSDAEILCVMHQTFKSLEVSHKIRFNDRRLLNALLVSLEAAEKSVPVLRAIDKLEKAGETVVREELSTAGLSAGQIDGIFAFTAISQNANSNSAVLSELKSLLGTTDIAEEGLQQVERVLSAVDGAGVPSEALALDLSIARGLDYYTGAVFETSLTDLPEIGSVCSGGRYDNLAGLYTKQDLPGVGASVGLDRLLAALEELGQLNSKSSTAQVLVTLLDDSFAPKAAEIAQSLRDAGIRAELFPQTSKIGAQLKYADRKGIDYVVVIGENELAGGNCALKNMRSGDQQNDIPIDSLAGVLAPQLEQG